MIRKFGGAAGVDSQPAGVDIGFGGGSNIKSIQSGTATFTPSASSMNISINAVDLSKSIIIVEPLSSENMSPEKICIRGSMSNATTLTFNRDSTYQYYNYYVTWKVIEFNNVRSKQSGIVLPSALTVFQPTWNEIAISSVNTEKSIIITSFSTTNTQMVPSAAQGPMSKFISNTKIGLGVNGQGYYAQTINWQVLEFN